MGRLKVIYYGVMFDSLGLSTAARAYVHALHSVGVELSVVNIGSKNIVSDPLVQSLLNRPITPDFHIFSSPPTGMLPLRLSFDRMVCQTVWETSTIPEVWRPILNEVLETWVPCEHNVSAFQDSIATPVFKWHHAIDPYDMGRPQADYQGLPPIQDSDFVFFSIFAWQYRKNPLKTVEAFFRAFPTEEDAVLVVKAGAQSVADCEAWQAEDAVNQLRSRFGSKAKVYLIHEYWSREQLEALYRRGNCYVSLHRGEGWCYPLFKAAYQGIPAVATAYSGPMEYLSPELHYLVNYVLVPVKQRGFYYHPAMQWAEPDAAHAAELMRTIYLNRSEAISKAQAGAHKIFHFYTPEKIGEAAMDRLNALKEQKMCSRK